LRPNIKKGGWTKDEEAMIQYYYQMFGPKWSAMAQVMKNRTDNDIKNKFYSMNRSAQRKKRGAGRVAAETSKGFIAGNICAMDFIGEGQGSSESFNPRPDVHFGFVLTQPQNVQPLYAGNSIVDVVPQFTNAPPHENQIAQTVTDCSSPAETLKQQQQHSIVVRGADFWENYLDF
jgi:hypothetical protein